jgi:hypothetical protein
VSNSVEPAPPGALAEPLNGLNEALPAFLRRRFRGEPSAGQTRRHAAPVEGPVAPSARPETPLQAIEKPRFAPENGAPLSSLFLPGMTRGPQETAA